MAEDKKRLIVIDSNSVIHRAFHALPPLSTKDGEIVNAVYGFLLVFLKAIREFRPDYVAAAFDLPSPTFRHKKFEKYKAKRPPAPKELYEQIPKVKEILKAFNVSIFEKEGFEADDLIGTISQQFLKKQIVPPAEVIILSGDKDVLQLVNKNTKAYILRKGVKDTVLYDENLVREKYQGLNPGQLDDFKALRGDPSDNIPGVRGIGEKTAIQLIKQFDTLENLYLAMEEKEANLNENLRLKLEQQKEQAFLSRELVQIRKDAPLDLNFKKIQWGEYNKEKIVEILESLEFYSLIPRLPSNDGLPEKAFPERIKKEKKTGKTEEHKENLTLW